ncbi:MAG: DUF2807 domain-containing protein [Acidobacteria bacterium]|nr:DUF2807 domain-containing protein [Acidobacteriota bacterium]HMU33974.1 head GIN domain-containing protein [Pyrinomonadaceae bacterium]
MKKIGFLLFLTALVIGISISGAFSFGPATKDLFRFGSIFQGEVGSGNVVTAERDVAAFDKLEVSGVFVVEVTRGDVFSVKVTADDNLMPFIRTEVDGDTLSIYTDKRISKTSELKVVITAPIINEASSSGVAKVTLKDINNERLALDASGASRITVSGKTNGLDVEASGASKILAAELVSKQASIETSGASNAELNVAEVLKATASGASHVRYSGSPTVDADRSGAATISQLAAN